MDAKEVRTDANQQEESKKVPLTKQLRLYVVTDEREDTTALLNDVWEAVLGGATCIQLRRKREDGGRLIELGRAIRTITREHGALYIVNDRVDIAMLTDADGVHVGQSDISCTDARLLVGDKVVGVSVATVEEAEKAIRDGADYLGVGSIYATSSKGDAEVCGLAALSAIARIAEKSGVPIVAIGGITLERINEVMRNGIDGVAVVSAVMNAGNVRDAAVKLAEAIRATVC